MVRIFVGIIIHGLLFWLFEKGASKSVQVLFMGKKAVRAVRVLKSIIPK